LSVYINQFEGNADNMFWNLAGELKSYLIYMKLYKIKVPKCGLVS